MGKGRRRGGEIDGGRHPAAMEIEAAAYPRTKTCLRFLPRMNRKVASISMGWRLASGDCGCGCGCGCVVWKLRGGGNPKIGNRLL
jgi:hypothetical protein